MADNIKKTQGLVFSQQLMLALVKKGILRESAYSMVQTNAMKSWNERLDFKELVLKDQEIMALISGDEIDRIFDYGVYTANVDFIFKRCGLE
jgi:adenylosuccinate lyase